MVISDIINPLGIVRIILIVLFGISTSAILYTPPKEQAVIYTVCEYTLFKENKEIKK